MTTKAKPDRGAGPVGATYADVILRILRSPYLAIPLLALAALLLVSIATGYVELSFGDHGVKLSQGPHGSARTDLNIAGEWHGQAKDLSADDGKLAARYAYTITMNFVQKGADVTFKGSYYIDEGGALPQRTIYGRGVLHEDYLSLLYDIEAGDPPVARTHGTMMLHILPSGQSGTGYYVTRSMANDGFVFGSIELTR